MPSTRNRMGLLATLISTFAIVLVAGALALAGGYQGARVCGVPVVWLAYGGAFLVQWAAFVPAYLKGTEKFYDAVGSATYLSVVLGSLIAVARYDLRSLLLVGAVSSWALRLGTFLVRRVHRQGGDGRFDAIKGSAGRFFVVWTLQGMWVSVTLAAALAAIAAPGKTPIGLADGIGMVVWAFGFGIEIVADLQKTRFRASPEGREGFIESGLWSWSRHPNYCGEILLWIGIAMLSLPTLEGWRYCTLVSPVFVYLLITKVSGIPLLESRADERWGQSAAYQEYKARTSLLLLRPPRSRRRTP